MIWANCLFSFNVFSFEKSRRCDNNQQITVSHFGEHKKLHLESSKQHYYIISSRAIIKAIFTSLQVSQQQLKIHTGSTADFLTRGDSSRDLLGKFHKDRSVWIRARRRVLQCLSYQFPCALQLKQWGVLNEVKCRLCEKYYKARNIPEPPDTVESVGHIQVQIAFTIARKEIM